MSQQQPRRQHNGYQVPPQGGAPQQQRTVGHNNAAFHAAADAAARTSSTTKAHLTAVRFDSLSISAPTKRCGRLSRRKLVLFRGLLISPPAASPTAHTA